MSEQQLRLLPYSKPLTERLGREFFLAIPREPGVYFMQDAAGQVIYVGKALCLRERLNSYRHVHPDRDSRKTVRMIHEVARIEWEICESETQALLRENELLSTLRPKFNRANTYPKACLFIGLKRNGPETILSLTRDTGFEGKLFGAFKPSVIFAYASLIR